MAKNKKVRFIMLIKCGDWVHLRISITLSEALNENKKFLKEKLGNKYQNFYLKYLTKILANFYVIRISSKKFKNCF